MFFFYSLQKYNALMFRETKDREESEAWLVHLEFQDPQVQK